jgi:hypothetical protein
MVERIQDIKLTGAASDVWVGPYDEAKKEMEAQGFAEIDLSRNAQLRRLQGKDAFVSRKGNWVKEDVVYVTGKGKYLTRVSQISANPKKATDCHRNGNDFYLTPEQVEQCLADSVLLSLKAVPTDRFGDDDITTYAFGKEAKEYGLFLKEAGIIEMPILTTHLQDKSFARKAWLCMLSDGDGSGLDGDDRSLLCCSRVRGVFDSAEGTARNLNDYLAQLQKTADEQKAH